MTESVNFRYTGSTPGADANTYILFSSVVAFTGASMAQNNGLKRIFGGINNPQAGTLNYYYSLDRGVNWVQVSTTAVAASAATDINEFDFLIESFPDFKVEWVNGGSAQTGWTVTIALSGERAPSA
jgi:hypothetical protein